VKSGGETRVVMPSMGNFISGMTWGIDPADPFQKWAPTGDSAILSVDVLRVGASTIILKAEAIPISNYMNGKGEMVVGKLEELAGGTIPLSPTWASYYRARLGAMKKMMPPAPLK
jgi:hypothetical protein